MELYYIVLSLPLCIVLFPHNILYIHVLLLLLLLLNTLSFIQVLHSYYELRTAVSGFAI